MNVSTFIDLLPPRDPASAALSVPQNFGVWGLRHHFAIHEPEGGVVFWMVCLEVLLSRAAAKTPEILPIFQQTAVGIDLSLQLDRDIQQGLVLLGLVLPLCPGLGQLWLQVQEDSAELLHLHGVAGLHFLRLFSKLAFRFLMESRSISRDWTVRLSSVRVISSSYLSVCEVTAAVLSLICWDQYLSSSSRFFWASSAILGPDVCHDLAKVLRLLGASNSTVSPELAIWFCRPFTSSLMVFLWRAALPWEPRDLSLQLQLGDTGSLMTLRSPCMSLPARLHGQFRLIRDSEVISSSKTGIVNLQNWCGRCPQNLQKIGALRSSMIFQAVSPVWPGVPSSPGVPGFLPPPVSVIRLPGLIFLQVGGQAVSSGLAWSPSSWMPPTPTRPLAILAPRPPDSSCPGCWWCGTRRSRSLSPQCPHRRWPRCRPVGLRWPDDSHRAQGPVVGEGGLGAVPAMFVLGWSEWGQDSRCWVVSFNSYADINVNFTDEKLRQRDFYQVNWSRSQRE